MLDRADLERDDVNLASLIHERVAGLELDRSAPQHVRDLACLFELDHQVRNGGWAQYFFNQSCLNSFDTWFATNEVATDAALVLELAFKRLGCELGIDLDLLQLSSDALVSAYHAVLAAYQRAHGVSGDLATAFAAFRDRLAGDRDGLTGFDALNQRFFTTDIPAAIVAHVRANPDPFIT